MFRLLRTRPAKDNAGIPIPCSSDALRLRPEDYFYPSDWVHYVNSMEGRMKRILDTTRADDLCDDMFDSDIDAAAQAPRLSAARQHTDHLQALWRRTNRLRGEIDARNTCYEDLLACLASMDAEIARCREAIEAGKNK